MPEALLKSTGGGREVTGRSIIVTRNTNVLSSTSGSMTIYGRCFSSTTPVEEIADDVLAREFAEHVNRWRDETGMVSSVTVIINHPSYQAIIKMGEPALPLILRELRDRRGLWFPALKTIAKFSPVPVEQQSNPKLAREAWLAWGRKTGLIE